MKLTTLAIAASAALLAIGMSACTSTKTAPEKAPEHIKKCDHGKAGMKGGCNHGKVGMKGGCDHGKAGMKGGCNHGKAGMKSGCDHGKKAAAPKEAPAANAAETAPVQK